MINQLPEGSSVTVLYGEKKVIFKPPFISKTVIKRRFWFDKEEYWIEWEYCRQGPFNLKDAEYFLGLALMAFR